MKDIFETSEVPVEYFDCLCHHHQAHIQFMDVNESAIKI